MDEIRDIITCLCVVIIVLITIISDMEWYFAVIVDLGIVVVWWNYLSRKDKKKGKAS